jgi:hypothetical protein
MNTFLFFHFTPGGPIREAVPPAPRWCLSGSRFGNRNLHESASLSRASKPASTRSIPSASIPNASSPEVREPLRV